MEQDKQEFSGAYIEMQGDREWVQEKAWRLVQMRYYDYITNYDPITSGDFPYNETNEECIKIAVDFHDVLESYEFEDEQVEGGEFDKESKSHSWE